jgi:uncharacterized coiled-coil protein SlyX
MLSAMDVTRHEALEAELAEAQRERERLDVVITYLSERLGTVPPPTTPDSPAQKPPGSPTAHPMSVVSEGEFFGMSAPKAAIVLMDRIGRSRPLKTDEIFTAVKRGGVSIGNSGSLYRSLFRDPRFHKVGRGLWGLSKWYGNAATAKGAKGQPAEPDVSEPEPEGPNEPETQEPPSDDDA